MQTRLVWNSFGQTLISGLKKSSCCWAVVAHTFDLSTWMAEAGGSL